MIPTYVISLAKEQKRRKNICAQCQQVGIEPILVDAIDMRQAADAEIQQLSQLPIHKKRKKQRWLTKGELGCALSHLAVYQQIISNQNEYALILEDDAKFIQQPEFIMQPETLNQIAEHYDFDVLILGYVKTLESQLSYYYRKIPIKTHVVLHDNNHKKWTFGTPWEQYGCGNVAYIITAKGAKKLLDFHQTPSVAADDWLYFEQHCGLKVLHCRPTLVIEDLENLQSTIRVEKANFLQPKLSSIIIRSIKGSLKNIAMNYLGFK